MSQLKNYLLLMVTIFVSSCSSVTTVPKTYVSGTCLDKASNVPLAIEGGVQTSDYDDVILIFSEVANSGYKCTGTIVGHNVVLTAAHCIRTDKNSTYAIETGSIHNVPEEIPRLIPSAATPRRILQNPKYSTSQPTQSGKASLDLAVLLFPDRTFNRRDVIVPSLYKMKQPPRFSDTIMVGYGGASAFDSTNATTAIKRAGRGFYLPLTNGTLITSDRMLNPEAAAATGPIEFSRAHPGDSGGPLFYESGGTRLIIGVASLGSDGNAEANQPLSNITLYADLYSEKSLQLLRQAISEGAEFFEPSSSQIISPSTPENETGC